MPPVTVATLPEMSYCFRTFMMFTQQRRAMRGESGAALARPISATMAADEVAGVRDRLHAFRQDGGHGLPPVEHPFPLLVDYLDPACTCALGQRPGIIHEYLDRAGLDQQGGSPLRSAKTGDASGPLGSAPCRYSAANERSASGFMMSWPAFAASDPAVPVRST